MKRLLSTFFVSLFLLLSFASSVHATDPEIGNGKTVTVTSQLSSGFAGSKAVDNDRGTYWESNPYSWSQNITVDLGASYRVSKLTFQLPTAWGNRTQNITILTSPDNTTYTTHTAAANYAFGSVDVDLSATPVDTRYVRLQVNSNNAANSAQLSEFLIYGIPTPTNTWNIQSVDSMKYTKDVVCNQANSTFINSWLDKAVELGANYVAVATPYDNPSCGNALTYTQTWVTAIRAHGLKVWHRHMGLSFEGLYGVTKKYNDDYLQLISNYIINNPTLFADGDIFTPTPEPDSAGINGVTYCPTICQFKDKSDFNQWIRNAQLVSKLSFTQIGLPNMKIGYYGTSGFIVFGENNPDWHGQSFLEQKTVDSMGGVIAMDTYPETYGGTMASALDDAHTVWPNATFVIGEWGTITGTNVEQQVTNSMGAASTRTSYVKGFNYWQPGPGGNEALWNTDFTNRSQFDEVKSFYKP